VLVQTKIAADTKARQTIGMQKLIQIESLRSCRKLNKQPMGYEAQLVWKCLLTPIFGWFLAFWPAK